MVNYSDSDTSKLLHFLDNNESGRNQVNGNNDESETGGAVFSRSGGNKS